MVVFPAGRLSARPTLTSAKRVGPTRRQWNHAFFEKLVVVDGSIARDERADPFADLLDPELLEQLRTKRAPPTKPVLTALVLKRGF
jgi:hypothetical protein